MTIKFEAIVATDNVGAIGFKNTIPWRCPEDMKRFKKITLGCPVIMGRTTYDSIGRPLPGRLNVVLSRVGAKIPGVTVVNTVAQARELAIDHITYDERCWERETAFIIGGAQIYRAFLPFYDGLHLTTVDTVVKQADTFFPVEAFLERFVKTNRLRLQQGSGNVIPDGGYRTTYAHYGIVGSYDARRADLANTAQHLPWSTVGAPTVPEEAEATTSEEEEE